MFVRIVISERLTMLIVTGSPGSGKTTVSKLLAQSRQNGLHIPSDVFYSFPSHPISPYRSAAHEQNTAVIRSVVRAAASFSLDGYDVILDGIFGEWFLPVVAKELLHLNVSLDYVVLQVSLQDAIARVKARSKTDAEEATRTMHAAFAGTNPVFFTVSTSGKSPVEVAALIESYRSTGQLRLDLATFHQPNAA